MACVKEIESIEVLSNQLEPRDSGCSFYQCSNNAITILMHIEDRIIKFFDSRKDNGLAPPGSKLKKHINAAIDALPCTAREHQVSGRCQDIRDSDKFQKIAEGGF